MAEPLAAEIEEAIADFSLEQDLAHQDVERHSDEHEIIERLIGNDRDLRERSRAAEEEEHAEHAAQEEHKSHRHAEREQS